MAEPAESPRRQSVGWGWFLAWVLVGTALALGTVSLGPLVVLPVLLVALVMLRREDARRSLAGLASGAGVLLLIVAFLNRDGPGTTCWHRGSASGCDQHLNPLPWLILGVVLVGAGLVVQGNRQR
jgi:hypothetical protein